MPGIGRANRYAYILGRLKRSLPSGGVRMHFQPIVCGDTGQLRGVEALIRWFDGDQYVPPLDYIIPAERTGFIVELGYWVLNESFRLFAEEGWGTHKIKLFVNLSGRQLREEDIASRIAGLASRHGVPPSSIVIEITETSPIYEGVDMIRRLAQLKQAGFLLALDDFGTGYSGLHRLQWMPVDLIKIDKSFVSKVGDGSGFDQLVRGMLAMARQRGLFVVVEGVETEAQQQWFFSESRDLLHQGYLYSKPVEAAKIREFFTFGKR